MKEFSKILHVFRIAIFICIATVPILVGCSNSKPKDPIQLQFTLLKQLKSASSDWQTTRVTHEAQDQDFRHTMCSAVILLNGRRYTLTAGDFEINSSIKVLPGDLDSLDKLTNDTRIGYFYTDLASKRFKDGGPSSGGSQNNYDSSTMQLLLPYAEQFRAAVREVLGIK